MCSCDLNHRMSPGKSVPQILAFCQKDQIGLFEQRQIPLQIDENFILQYQVDDSFLILKHGDLKKTNLDYQRFIKGYQKLSSEELDNALTVPLNQIKEHILQNVSCVGCRTSIDSFMKSLIEYGHPALEPLVMNENGSISIDKSSSSNCDQIFQLFHIYGSKLKDLIEIIPKSKKNRRCLVHSLDKTRSLNDWEYVWEIMNNQCRNEITVIEFKSLLATIETYLRKFKFCSECRLKVLEAYDLLTDDCDSKRQKAKGFCSSLYEGFQSCPSEKHIHVDCRKDFICKLINRAEIEIQGGRRERHAKTIDVAQEEILTCIGIYLFEKFEKIYRLMKSEEQIWKLVYSIGIDCLRMNFGRTIDQKQDLNVAIENLCEEMRLADQIKATKKRSKRKSRKQVKSTDNDKLVQNSDKEILKISYKSEEILTRRRANSCCSCLCHYCDEQSNTTSNILKSSLIKSHSCPSLFSIISNQIMPTNSLPLSNSLDTLFSTMATRECICHEKNLEKEILCDECPISSSTTRLDLGYSSEQDDNCSSNPCECTSTGCDGCSTELSNCCPLHEEDESSMSMLSSGVYSHNCCFHENRRMIELSDQTGKSKLQLQLSDDYPFFQMNFKEIWEENSSANTTNQAFISDADRRQFFLLHKNFHKRREQLRRRLKYKFQLWKQSSSCKT